MHALVLFAHPEPSSLTGSTAQRIAADLIEAGGTAEVADLAGEGFDPRFSEEDLRVLRGLDTAPKDVRREQERVERADALVFVHPVYWWGMPALMKGWFDRVLTFGWAFGTDGATALAGRDAHLLRLGGNSPQTYEEHGYRESIRNVTEHGLFEFVSGPVASSSIVHSAPEGLDGRITEAVDSVVSGITRAAAAREKR